MQDNQAQIDAASASLKWAFETSGDDFIEQLEGLGVGHDAICDLFLDIVEEHLRDRWAIKIPPFGST